MLKFIREGRKISVDPMSLTLEPLMKIWVADKSESKTDATKRLAYIHLVSQIDPEAPYVNADPTEVPLLVKKELYADMNYEFPEPFNNDFMYETVNHYQMAYEVPEHAVVRSFNNKIHEMKRIMDETPIEISKSVSRGAVTYVSNFTIMNKMMQDITKVVKARDEMKAAAIRETAQGEGKGARSKSFLEKRRRELSKARRTVEVDESAMAVTVEADEVDEL